MTVEVAVALIFDTNGKILITQRCLTDLHGGSWEFPGGKVEANENCETALIREIKEEVDLTVEQFELFTVIEHAYPHYKVRLQVYRVTKYSGFAVSCEKQLDLQWVEVPELARRLFPAANEPIVAKLLLTHDATTH